MWKEKKSFTVESDSSFLFSLFSGLNWNKTFFPRKSFFRLSLLIKFILIRIKIIKRNNLTLIEKVAKLCRDLEFRFWKYFASFSQLFTAKLLSRLRRENIKWKQMDLGLLYTNSRWKTFSMTKRKYNRYIIRRKLRTRELSLRRVNWYVTTSSSRFSASIRANVSPRSKDAIVREFLPLKFTRRLIRVATQAQTELRSNMPWFVPLKRNNCANPPSPFNNR